MEENTEKESTQRQEAVIRFGIARGIIQTTPDMGRVYDNRTIIMTPTGRLITEVMIKLVSNSPEGINNLKNSNFSETTIVDQSAGLATEIASAFQTAFKNPDVDYIQPVEEMLEGKSDKELIGIGLAMVWKGLMKNQTNSDILEGSGMRAVVKKYNLLYPDFEGTDLEKMLISVIDDVGNMESVRRELATPRIMGLELKEPRLAGSLKQAVIRYVQDSFGQHFTGDINSYLETGGKGRPRFVMSNSSNKWWETFKHVHPDIDPAPNWWKIKPIIVMRHGVGRDHTEFNEAKNFLKIKAWW